MICWSRVVPFIIIILYFSLKIINYIWKRNALTRQVRLLNGDDRWDEKYIKLNEWLMKKIGREKDFNVRNERGIDPSPSSCRELALLVSESQKDRVDVCQEMSRDVCGLDSRLMEKVVIPRGEKTSFVSANGMHLIPGETYCVFKRPPLLKSNVVECNERWGYWKYSPIQDRWVCHSKLPGIYDAEKDAFTPCSSGGGRFTIDDRVVPPEILATRYEPRDFYDVEFQKRCGCRCNGDAGYVFVPEKSRTTCFKDPCRAALPPFSAAVGYAHDTKTCECGDYFTNQFNDKRQPCTACPYDRPQYDANNYTLTVYVKCGSGKDDLFPCESAEDEIRGCRKAIVRVKPREKMTDDETFEERMFW